MIVNIDGEFHPAEGAFGVTDGAVLFGDTLFETMRAEGQRIRHLASHLDRLQQSARLIDFPFDRPAAEGALARVCEKLDTPCSRVRLTLCRGPYTGLQPTADRSRVIVTAAPYTPPTVAESCAGAVCVTAPNRRVNPLSHLPQMKRGSYADCLYAAAHARSLGAREALFVTEDGHLLEGSTTNVFLLKRSTLITPPAGEVVLPGIMRAAVIRAASEMGLAVEERPVPVEEIFEAQEAFLTNALIETLAVASLDGRPVRRGNLERKLRNRMAPSPPEGA